MRKNREDNRRNQLNRKKNGYLCRLHPLWLYQGIWFPSGSTAVTIYPTLGTSCLGEMIFPPSLLTFSIDSPIDSTEM
jgi:hypothetical protein